VFNPDNCEVAELLLSKGAYVDPMWEQKTPLFLASQCGNDRIMELLLRHQADVNIYFFPASVSSSYQYMMY